MTDLEKSLDEMLDLGKIMGPGERILLLYYGQFAITSVDGYLRWPEGPKKLIALIKPREYDKGISKSRRDIFLKRARGYLYEFKR